MSRAGLVFDRQYFEGERLTREHLSCRTAMEKVIGKSTDPDVWRHFGRTRSTTALFSTVTAPTTSRGGGPTTTRPTSFGLINPAGRNDNYIQGTRKNEWGAAAKPFYTEVRAGQLELRSTLTGTRRLPLELNTP